MTYNPYILFRNSEPSREFQVAKVIRDVNPDILLVQELAANTPQKAIDSVYRLANMTGMQCELQQGSGTIYTAVKGSRTHAVGILWNQRAGIKPIPESWRVIQAGFWHAIAILTFEVNGVLVDHAVYHGAPRNGRTNLVEVQQGINDEARTIASLATQPHRLPLLFGADWNYLSADMASDGYYYAVRNVPQSMNPAIKMYACSREAGQILLDAGLFDVSAATFDPQIGRMLTTGHWPNNKESGIIDGFKATPEFRRAIISSRVIDTATARTASDHLPCVAEYDPLYLW
jgi:exonuclease III